MNRILDHIPDKRKKNHKRETCGKSFLQVGYLKRHINSIHNGQKDHKCDSCGKLFFQAEHLKKHVNSIHNGQ